MITDPWQLIRAANAKRNETPTTTPVRILAGRIQRGTTPASTRKENDSWPASPTERPSP